MVDASTNPPQCSRCGSSNLKLCEQSIQYAPEEWLGQSLELRELHTLAYQCDCGLAFTHTVRRQHLPPGAR
jgi:hypothetical protein